MKKPDDHTCIEKVRKGEDSAFAVLVDRYKDMVYTIVHKIVRSHEETEEIAQDVFLKAYHSLNSFKGKSKFSTWLYRIAYNAAITQTRKKKIEMGALDEQLMENYTQDAINEDIYTLDTQQQKQFIDHALSKLPETEYLIISFYHKEECAISEIAEITGLSESNVKVKLHRIRKKLYNELDVLMKEKLINRQQ
ncbi:MAG: sigma-70 family RNA polymerase sigma factor [Bacteroidales bacterium]|nr:sigma-70 family RNA polymerase sigma factor [Bacteroidales bacterium]MCF8334014.1 sigma-70 family RNA polymerase sigma factor [Bacteroidales bacterium]